jgi:hypothetical protein
MYRDALRLSRAQFADRYRFPFLVPELSPASVKAAEAEEPDDDFGGWGDEVTTGVTQLDEVRRYTEFHKQIFAIRKVQTVYSDMITVGRTANHDIPLRDPSVSKFQAHFKLQPSGVYVVDAGSTRGTTVDGQKLWPRQPTLVVVGSLIGFGDLRFRLLTAEGAHQAVLSSR